MSFGPDHAGAPGGAESPPRWYAVHLRSNRERISAALLADRGVEVFLPAYRVASSRRDRRVVLERPLFRGYLFARLDLHGPGRIEVLRAPGTVRIVGFGPEPTPIADPVIDSLMILVGAGCDEIRAHPLVRAGQRVRVVDGPFAGAVGVLARAPGRRDRLVVEIDLLGRAVAVPIDPEQVEPLLAP
ncbi:MAG TPA: transcription termination/antitermination NusG family protein [Polyangia bacterium]|nr:transcription termination/antitermination NusG family protein [Polyangia bacterium]